MVRLTGLEPVRPYGHQILSLRRLPITPQSRCLVSVGRIELPLHAPKARVIPFHYTELFFRNFIPTQVPQNAPAAAGINNQ